MKPHHPLYFFAGDGEGEETGNTCRDVGYEKRFNDLIILIC
jgi:hypothetical protein